MDGIATIVTILGEAEANYDLVSFSLSVCAEDITALSAKLKLKDKIMAVDQAVKSILEVYQTKMVKEPIRSITVQSDYPEGNTIATTDSFQAVYNLSFQVDSMDKINQILNELSALHEVVVPPPYFFIKNIERLNKKALKDAWKKVSERFTEECEILKLNPDHYEIVNWVVAYSNVKKNVLFTEQQMLRDLEAQSDIEEVNKPNNIVIGMAKINATLSVSFKKKS